MTGLVLGLGLGAISLQAAPMAVPTDVFVLGGQSNGTDLAPWDSGADWPLGCYQLERWTLPLVTDMPGSGATEIAPAAAQIIAAARPLHHHYRTPPAGFGWSLQFVRDYVAANPGVDVVLIPCCWGGTGFVDNRWNPGNDLYADMVARTNAVMAAHPTWSLKGLLWHQGEADSTTTADADAHPARLEAMIAAFRTAVSAPNLPVVCGGYVASYAASRPLFLQTMAAQADLPNRLAYTGFAASDGTTGQAGAEAIHFSAASMRVMGSRYLAAWQAARVNAPTLPAQVTGLVATAGDSKVTLSWTAPAPKGSPIIDYLIERQLGAGVWVTVSDGLGTGTGYTDTGLTNGTACSYRVSAVNALGTGPASATASATPAANGPSVEAGAAGHWLFGADNTGLAGLVGGSLVENAPAITAFNTGHLSLSPANGKGLVSAISETANMTMCIVFRMVDGISGWENILIGNLKNATGGQALYHSTNIVKHNKYVGAAQVTQSSLGSNGVWTFAAVSLDAAGNRVLYVRKAGAAVVTTSTVASLGLYASPLAIGPVYFTSSTYNDPFDVAEAILFAAAKTQTELDAIYTRTATRLADRGITLGGA